MGKATTLTLLVICSVAAGYVWRVPNSGQASTENLATLVRVAAEGTRAIAHGLSLRSHREPSQINTAIEPVAGRSFEPADSIGAQHHPDALTKAHDERVRRRLAKSIQVELRRVGCFEGEIDGQWSTATRVAMKAFTDRVNVGLPLEGPYYILLTLLQGYKTKACGHSCPSGQMQMGDGSCDLQIAIAQSVTNGVGVDQRVFTRDAQRGPVTDGTDPSRTNTVEVQTALRATKTAPPDQQLDAATAKARAHVIGWLHRVPVSERPVAPRATDDPGPPTIPRVQGVARDAKAVVDPESAIAHLHRGIEHRRTGQFDLAIAEYNRALAINPNLAAAYNARSWAYFKHGRAADGLADAEKALKLNPDDPSSLDTRGHILEALGRKQEAITDFRRALVKDPSRKQSSDALDRLLVGL